ncbi:uncharacterized protein LOC144909193 [Branchiostoma floridae x Branchiostoma belcheri]
MAAGENAETELDKVMKIVQMELGKDWKILAGYLGLSEVDVQQIENEKELVWQGHSTLVKWRQRQGRGATVERLLAALKNIRRQDLVDKLYPCQEDGSAPLFKQNTFIGVSCPKPKKYATDERLKKAVKTLSLSCEGTVQDLSRGLKLALNALKCMQLAKQTLKKCFYLKIEETEREGHMENLSQLYDANEDLCRNIIADLFSRHCQGIETAESFPSSIYVQIFPETDECTSAFNEYLESGKLAADLHEEFEKIGFHSPLQVATQSTEQLEEKVAEIVEEAMDVFLSEQTDETTTWGDALLRITAWTGDEDKVKTLLQAGVQVNTENSEGETPLWDAVKGGNPNIVSLLLQEGADTSKVDKNGSSPLAYARRHRQVCKTLLQHAEVSRAENYQQNPLWIAIENADAQLLTTLIEEGTDVNKQIGTSGYSPLCLSAEKIMQCEERNSGRTWHDCVHVFETLISGGAKINHVGDRYGQTLLMSACTRGCNKTVKLLLNNGADPSQVSLYINYHSYTSYTRTPLCKAAESGNAEIMSDLIQAGADLNQADKGGRTPLFLAAQSGHTETVRILTQAGADLNQADKGGRTPLFLAAQSGHTETVRILTQAGADLNKADYRGKTPLMVAAESGHGGIVSILKQAEADK